MSAEKEKRQDSVVIEPSQSLRYWSFFSQDVHSIRYAHGVTSANAVGTNRFRKKLKWRMFFDDNFVRKDFLRKEWTRMNRLQNLMQMAMVEIVNGGDTIKQK